MKKLSELTPEEKQSIALEFLQWEYDQATGNVFFFKEDEAEAVGMIWPSLDAMAEAEVTLTFHEWEIFNNALREQVMAEEENQSMWFIRKLSRTAAQRLDAFLIAKGLATL